MPPTTRKEIQAENTRAYQKAQRALRHLPPIEQATELAATAGLRDGPYQFTDKGLPPAGTMGGTDTE